MENLEIYSEKIVNDSYIVGIEKYYKIGNRRFKAVFKTGGSAIAAYSLYEHANGKWNFCDDYDTVGLSGEWEQHAGAAAMALGKKMMRLFEDKIINFYC